MATQQPVNPQENVVDTADPMSPCITPGCEGPKTHQRYWHDGKSGSGKCTRADCPCESGTYEY